MADKAIREIKGIREHDERLERMRSVSGGSVEVNQEMIHGDLLGHDSEVGLTLHVVTSDGREYQIDGIFLPRHRTGK